MIWKNLPNNKITYKHGFECPYVSFSYFVILGKGCENWISYIALLAELNFPLFFQSILGIVISALTGSEDPEEVSLMAKQATEVT